MKMNIFKWDKIVRNTDLEPLEKCVLQDLMLHGYKTGNIFPSEQTLASAQNRSVRQIRTALYALRSKGWIIKWEKRGYSQSNSYTLKEELYFRNGDNGRIPTSSQLRSELPLQNGSPLPPKIVDENNKVSSTQQIIKDATKGKSDYTELNRILELCTKYPEADVIDAVKEATNRDPAPTFIRAGLIINILKDWETHGKPQPKPKFVPCNQGRCVEMNGGWLIESEGSQMFHACDCREKYDLEYQEWKDKYGSY